jgi:TPP-dependent pyruvate/acetoin dehydrogenase alpha subunit
MDSVVRDTVVSDTEVVSLLEAMMLIRAYEDKNIAEQAAGKSAGTCTSVGQEASAVGVVRALGAQDLILTNHRSAGHLLARGADPGRMMAEVKGRKTGYCKGKSGTLHISVKELGVILTSTIVGGELSLATGVGLSQSMQGNDAVVACFFGDGAACEGVFHESLNLAAVWNLPVLYVCENNQWQAYVHRKETMLTDKIATRAAGYGIEAATVDGNDVEAVLKAATEAVAYIRKTGKPYLLETYTYRVRGHFEPDDQAYVDPAELARWKVKDPIALLKGRLLERQAITEAELDQLSARVLKKIDQAAAFAGDSPFPSADELTTDVYA